MHIQSSSGQYYYTRNSNVAYCDDLLTYFVDAMEAWLTICKTYRLEKEADKHPKNKFCLASWIHGVGMHAARLNSIHHSAK